MRRKRKERKGVVLLSGYLMSPMYGRTAEVCYIAPCSKHSLLDELYRLHLIFLSFLLQLMSLLQYRFQSVCYTVKYEGCYSDAPLLRDIDGSRMVDVAYPYQCECHST